MKSLTNSKLKKKLKSKGITLDEKKKKQFDNYSYYQVVNAYKNIFITGIENIVKNIIDLFDDNIKKFSCRKYLFYKNLLEKSKINFKYIK